MSIKLNWVNRNTQPVTVTIYRGTSPLDRTALPAPLATLSNGETSYVDLTAVQGAVYYYVFKTTNGSETVISRNQKMQAAETRGPGSNILQYGDRELGLYDVLPADSFISAANLNTLVGSPISAPQPHQYWYKYARRGKVYMVPEKILGYGGLYYNLLEAKGLINGVTVNIGGFNWKVRAMRGWSESDSGIAPPSKALGTIDTTAYTQTCEFNDFVYPMVAATPPTQRIPSWLQQTVSNLAYSTNGQSVLVAEKALEGDRAFTRWFAAFNTTERARLTGANFNPIDAAHNTYGWWPVLELVEV